MGAQVNSGLTTATISGNVSSVPAYPKPTSTQVAGMKCVQVTGTGANMTLFTTTAGKTAYVYMMTLRSSAASAYAFLRDNADTVLLATINCVGANSFCTLQPGFPFIVVPASNNLRAGNTFTASDSLTIWYWEE